MRALIEAIDVGINATSVDATTGVVSSGPDLQLIQNARSRAGGGSS